ncbi:hypothetical protein RUE5091_02574 [Ruegeria denitrificans]|uniref:Uncharacterized protein n=2 Tax=Ruegeria denitrificans TaxID=1715692 RepID=A0A0N7M9V5_9RHOB|nr:hypothetical protein RUE5091_02574 [Ruegeria denitrificans]
MMRFDWSKVDLKLGLWFAVVSFVVMNLAQFRDAAWMTAGLSALLAWLPLLLTQHRHVPSGIAAILVYLVAGCILSFIGHASLSSEVARVLIVGVISFVAVLTLRFGTFCYLVGYVLVFWYVLSPLFSANLGLYNTIEGHLVGCLGILIFWILQGRWVDGYSWDRDWPVEERTPFGIVLPYAGILSATMMIGFGVGGRILSSDPTIMAQASLNIISPSGEQTWQAGIGRMIFGAGGAIVGFYIGLLFPGLIAYELVIAVCSFVALAFLWVNIGFLVGAFAIMFTYPIGAVGEAGHAIGNEKLLAEFLGIFLAVIAIWAIGRRLAKTAA